MSLLNVLIRHFFDLSLADLLANPDFRLTESEILKLHFAVKELKDFRPVQYILGETTFLGLKIKLNESVLIPRPETEELVQLVLSGEKVPGLKVLDIGTGSGCIALALKKKMDTAQLSGTDISPQALELARQNSLDAGVEVSFFEMDILDEGRWPLAGKYDVIVSNPPYVTQSEKKLMQDNVLKYEPHQALFVPDDDALVFYRTIFDFAGIHLKPGGRIYLEINETKGEEVAAQALAKDFEAVKLHNDIHGKNRFISAIRKK